MCGSDASHQQDTMRSAAQAPARLREDRRGARQGSVATAIERRKASAGVMAQHTGMGGHNEHGEQSGNGESHPAPFRSDSRLVLPQPVNKAVHTQSTPQGLNRLDCPAYSAFAPENFTTFAHFSVSSPTSFPN